MKITNTNKDFILDNYFYNPQFAGWKNIAEKLIDQGSCVVAGDTRIWVGGIGNFIDYSTPDNFLECTKYSFDLDAFLRSNWFMEGAVLHLTELSQRKALLETDIATIEDILNQSHGM